MCLRATSLLVALAALAFAAAPAAQIALPVTFEEAIDYEIDDFGGNSSEIVVDPADGTNMVLRSTRTAGAEGFAGTTIARNSGFAEPIPFADGMTTMSVDVWTPVAGTPVRFKVEKFDDVTISVEVELTTSVGGAWETLVFDFAEERPGSAEINFANTYNMASIFFNFGEEAAAEATDYYWDNVTFGGTPGPGGNVPAAFDGDTAGGPLWTRPFTPGDGTSGSCSLSDTGTDVTYQQIFFTVDTSGDYSVEATYATHDGYLILYAGSFDPLDQCLNLIALNDDGPGGTGESLIDPVSLTDGTEYILVVSGFDPAEEGAYNGVIDGPEGAIVTFSDVPPMGAVSLPVTFDAAIDYQLRDFGGNSSEIVADPAETAFGGNLVLRSIRTAGAADFAGTAIADVTGLTEPIPFADGMTTMSLDVWTPVANTPVRLKLETAGGGPTVEVQVRSAVGGEWGTLVFDFSNELPGTPPLDLNASYNKPVVFYNFGETGATEASTYYADNLVFGGVAPPANEITLPVTFEDGDTDYEIDDFGGNASEIVVDPTDASNMVLRSTRTAGAEGFAGTTIARNSGFAEPIPFADGMTTMSVDVWTPVAGTPVRFKVEKFNDVTISVEVELVTTVGGAWETLVFDFAEERPGSAEINFANTYNMASIFFNFGEEAAAEATDYYWDNVTFGGTPVAAEDDVAQTALSALRVSPNPSASAAEVAFTLGVAGEVTVDVVDLLGRRVAVLADGPQAAGAVRLGLPTAGLPTGVYVVRVRTDEASETVRFTVVR